MEGCWCLVSASASPRARRVYRRRNMINRISGSIDALILDLRSNVDVAMSMGGVGF